MNLAWSHGYTLLTLIGCLAGIGRSTHPYPLGINFGQGNITAALIQENGEPLLIADIPASDSYRELARESAPNRSPELNLNIICEYWYHDLEDSYSYGPDRVPAFEEIFTENLKRIRDEASTVLGHETQISSISAPSHFNDSVRQAIKYSAAGTLNHFDSGQWLISTPEYGALHWYKLHQCEGPGRVIEGAATFSSEQRYVIFVNMNYDYLELVLVMAFALCDGEYKDHGTLETVSRLRIRNMGTKRLYTAAEIQESDPDEDRWHRELLRFWREMDHVFEDFADAHFSVHNHPFDPDEDTNPLDGTLHFGSLKAIVISGEMPEYAFDGVRYTIGINFPGSEDRILDSIEPIWVGAVGAAQLAKSRVEDPDRFEQLQSCFLEPLIMADEIESARRRK